ncbi:unnamed protein product [Diamesa hyperborea]
MQNGFQIRNLYVTQIKEGNQLLKFLANSTATLTSDCKMLHSMCFETNGYQTLKGDYKLYKGNMKLNDGTMDVCDRVTNPNKNFKKVLTQLQWPVYCPVKAYKNCYGIKSIDISTNKRFVFLLAGDPIRLEVTLTSEIGQAAFAVGLQVYKK